MSQMILLVDYEPRTVARVTEALAPLDLEVVTAKDVDAAVGACAKHEPAVVLISSVLPKVKVGDAITQLRARAGLRFTPFVILMSGYTGNDPVKDAAEYDGQLIVAKPFSNEELLGRVRTVIEQPRGSSAGVGDTRSGVMEALRRSAGLDPAKGTVTSEDLFGDLIGDEEEAQPSPAVTQRIPVEAVFRPEPVAAPPTSPPPAATTPRPAPPKPAPQPVPRSPLEDSSVDRTVQASLADMLGKDARSAPREDTGGASVDELLSQTLSGLEVKIPKREKPAAPAPPPKPEPAKVEASRPAPPVKGPLTGGTPFGQYQLESLIATGGMAEVYKARMQGVEGFQKIVAIKRILSHLTDNDEFVTMFIDEAKLAAQLQHPNIIHIYDLGKIDKSYYIAMEFIDGRDLRSILRTLEEQKRRMPTSLAVYIASRLAAALDYAHRKRDLQGSAMALVHRDVSPQNVLISYDGDIKLCDFGIAKAASKASHTRAGALKGKLQYMSPEQAWGKDLDHRSDIFSLGLVLYEMLTGRKAFAGDSELSILEQVRSPKLVPPREIDPTIPAELDRVVMKSLQQDRERRYQTAAELAAELEAVLQASKPVPGAAELGAFLTELEGRGRPGPLPAASPEPKRPEPAPAPPEPRRPAAPVVPAAAPAPPPPARVEVAAPMPQKRSPVVLIAAAVAVAAIGGAIWFFLARAPRDAASPGATPGPSAEMAEMARRLAEQEVAAREGELRERLASEMGLPSQATAPETGAPTTTGPVPAPAVAPAQQAPAAVAPTAAPTPRPTLAPTIAPTPVPTEEPAAALPAPAPTLPPPTPVPTAVPTRPPLAAPVTTVREGDLVDNPDTPPQPVSTTKATYPPLARQRRVEGTVILRALVDENGTVQEVQVLRGVRPDLGIDNAAATALRSWRFRPATKDGVRVKAWYTTSMPFQL
ncbi:MAG: TonB family protein [Acidobacteriota bacterium]|jgi:TonB family protein